jgi:hypothetical protein
LPSPSPTIESGAPTPVSTVNPTGEYLLNNHML